MDFIKQQEKEAIRLLDVDPEYYQNLNAVFLGLVGFEFDQDSYVIQTENGDPIAFIRRVNNNPGDVALTRAINPITMSGAIGRYSQHVTYELAVPIVDEDDPDFQTTIDAAFQLSACLRIAGAVEGIIPVALRRSWSVVCGINDNSCDAFMFEDFPKAKRFRKPPPLDGDVINDVGKYLDNFSKLYEENAAYRTAVNSYCFYCHSHDSRLIAASLWTGIEALFNIDHELRFRLALYISVIAETEGTKRYEKFKKVKALYDTRSKIVHGRKISKEDIASHIISVSLILGNLLYTYMINGVVLNNDEIEKILLHPEDNELTLSLFQKYFDTEQNIDGEI